MSRFAWLPKPLHRWLVAQRDRRRQARQARELATLRERSVKRVVVGAGPTHYEGWVSTDMAALDLLDEGTWSRYVAEGSLDAILAEHVWEHLDAAQALTAARTCLRFLKPGGRLRVAVPDGLHPDPAYVAQVRPGGSGPGADDHKLLYTHDSFAAVFEAAGFRTDKLEYFDAQGLFHAVDWDPADGMIGRSQRFDRRNRKGLVYTSIVIDALKPADRG